MAVRWAEVATGKLAAGSIGESALASYRHSAADPDRFRTATHHADRPRDTNTHNRADGRDRRFCSTRRCAAALDA